jgi:hypothetical protein
MDAKKAAILAGIFAVVDAGMQNPAQRKVIHAIKSTNTWTAESSVNFFGNEYMETNAHERMFQKAAKGWLTKFKAMDDAVFAKTWPDMAQLWDDAAKAV